MKFCYQLNPEIHADALANFREIFNQSCYTSLYVFVLYKPQSIVQQL